jgi:stearoyl-CoA desaturase (delta-9 desaturase)
MVIIAFLIGHWYLSLFCQTFFLHRYAAHGMYKMNPFWEKFFYFLTYLSQGPSFLNPKAYSIMHQRHHHFSDTSKDPHSPYNHKSLMQMMLHTYKEYNLCMREVYPKDVKHLWPTWKLIDGFAVHYVSILLWAGIYILIYSIFATSMWVFLLLPLHFFMGPIQGAIVNWCGHKIGYRNFSLNDKSKNTLLVDFLLMGELFQNNHHKFSQRSNFAHRWYEWDTGYFVISILEFFKIVKKSTSVAKSFS